MFTDISILIKRFLFGTPDKEIERLNNYKEIDYLRNMMVKYKSERDAFELKLKSIERMNIFKN